MAAPFRAAFDGGSRGNPGPAAWGVAVLAANGDCVEGHAGVLGHATNNVAEYHGLLQALKLAHERGADQVEILADSELIVRQIQGRYKVKNAGIIPLYNEVVKLAGTLAAFTATNVRRGQNAAADGLANEALDRK